MNHFLNEYGFVVFGIVKILVMFGYFLNLAPILVFAERRQAALIQDRLGPNRAMVRPPGWALKGALATPALLGAAAVAYLCFAAYPPKLPDVGVTRGFWLGEFGTFFLWSHTLILAGFARKRNLQRNPIEKSLHDMHDPRVIFYAGCALHLVVFALYAGGGFEKVVAYGGPALLVGVLVVTALYAAYAIPNGPVELRVAGMLHSMADALKVAFKEDFIPPNADRLLHSLAPLIALFPALVTYAVVPFGDDICFQRAADGSVDYGKLVDALPRGGVCDPQSAVSLQIANLNVGILYLFAIAGTGIVGAAIAGWSSDNKWSLLGGLRAASQMVSYEVAMGLSIVGAFMIYGTPRLNEMVRWQDQHCWGIFVQPLAFFLFFAASIAEQKRVPFDAPEGESEIIAGYFVEYASMKFLMFMTGEYIEMAVSSALLVTIFLGGWSIPFVHADGVTIQFGDSIVWQAALSHLAVTILHVLAFFAKVTVLAFWQIFIRWTVPRFRYDQIMAFGWKMLLPASIGNLVVTGLGILVLDQGGPAVQSTLRLLADVSNAVVVAAVLYVVVRLVLLLLSPVERHKFTASTAAARAARFGGVKEGAMQALSGARKRRWEAESWESRCPGRSVRRRPSRSCQRW